MIERPAVPGGQGRWSRPRAATGPGDNGGMGRRLSPRDLNRATLARQLLLERAAVPVVEAVHRVMAVQAQEPPSPYVALWNRVAGFDPADLDAAFAAGTVLKASLMRITLHAVTAADYPALRAAMLPALRGSRLADQRYVSTRLSVAEVEALAEEVLAFAAEPRTNAEIEGLLAERLGGPPERGVWWTLRIFTPLVLAPTGGPWTFGPRPAYVAAPTPEPAAGPPPDHDAALAFLVRRYLAGFGPASLADIAQFTRHKRTAVGAALAAMDGLDTVEGPDGAELVDVPDAPLPPGDTPVPPRLMAMWDSALLAYADRSRIIPAEYRPLIVRVNGDVLPTLLVDGFVAGVWRPVEGGIEAGAFHPLPDDAWAGLAAEADGLHALIAGRGPAYTRYHHWWRELPVVDTRLLRSGRR